MQEIVPDLQKFKKVISVDDCIFSDSKIYAYCVSQSDGIRVLVNFATQYYWSALCLKSVGCYGNTAGYATAKEAVVSFLSGGGREELNKVFIFDSQCELRDWARKHFKS